MAMKDYSDEFKADAVDLYESTPGATYKTSPLTWALTGRPCASGCCGTANAVASPRSFEAVRPTSGGGTVR